MRIRSAASTMTSLALLTRHVVGFRVSSGVRIRSPATPSSSRSSARRMSSTGEMDRSATNPPARGPERKRQNAFDFETPIDRSNTGESMIMAGPRRGYTRSALATAGRRVVARQPLLTTQPPTVTAVRFSIRPAAAESLFCIATPQANAPVPSGSLKLDVYGGRDVIPLWVADMDLKTSPAIIDAVKKRADHGIFGYSFPTEGVKTAVMNYYKDMHGVDVGDKSWLFFTPGTIQSMHAACKMLPETASVMVMTPSYPPFFKSPKNTGRGLVLVPADRAGGRWTLDWNGMEEAMRKHPETALLMLCNPYNPVGRVFTEEELLRVGDFCERHDLTIVSDEIHSDLILDEGVRHISMLALDNGRFASRTILLNAPSKTYNVPGLACSYAIIPDKKLRVGFEKAAAGWIGLNSPLGYVGCEAAYTEGEPWRQALLEHLRGNRAALYAFMEEKLPELRLDPMEATYLAWVDVTKLGWKSPALEFERAGVGLTDGKGFLGEGYVRINFACPREMLMEGLRRMEQAVIKEYREKQDGVL